MQTKRRRIVEGVHPAATFRIPAHVREQLRQEAFDRRISQNLLLTEILEERFGLIKDED